MKTLNSPKKTQNKTTLIGSSLSIIALLILLIANQTIATNKSNKVESDTQFTTSNSDLPSNEIKAIYVDSVNVAWIGTDAGLSRYNGQNWTTYTTSDHLLDNNVNDIAYEQSTYSDEIWIATNGGLTVASFDTDGITEATTYTPENSDLIGLEVSNVMVDKDHNRWIGTTDALNLFQGSTWKSELFGYDTNGDQFNYSDNKITDIQEYALKDMAFITTNGKGIVRTGYDSEIDAFTGASAYGTPWAAILTDSITSVSIEDEIQWYGTTNGIHYHPYWDTKTWWEIYTVESNNILSNTITAIHIDKESNIWAGTNEGINIIKNDGKFMMYTEEQGLINNYINTITSDVDGNVWVGTKGGIEWFDYVPGIDVPTSVKTNLVNDKVALYPNPASELFTIDISIDRPQFVVVSIYNTNGQLIDVPVEKKIRDSNSKHQIDTSNKINFKPGIYIVQIKCEDYTQFSKIEILN
ncbi:MAG: T9SS type A sorting domain-containing protein [Prolixibacteraceae bacterium]|nr:T9SS type A sorting domain-containing protein [Prolixibacteraceae bacterium]